MCLSCDIRLLITPLVSLNLSYKRCVTQFRGAYQAHSLSLRRNPNECPVYGQWFAPCTSDYLWQLLYEHQYPRNVRWWSVPRHNVPTLSSLLYLSYNKLNVRLLIPLNATFCPWHLSLWKLACVRNSAMNTAHTLNNNNQSVNRILK